MFNKALPFIFLFCLLIAYKVVTDLQVTRHDVTFSHGLGLEEPLRLKIAVVGDPHINDTAQDFKKHRQIVADVLAADPDLVLLVGDYTALPGWIADMAGHRPKVAALLKPLTAKPTVAILGNYETYTGPEEWLATLRGQGIATLENQVVRVTVKGREVCVRGLGDFYTDRYRHADFPVDCMAKPRLTITHDPAAAFEDHLDGLTIAGHTHCGQIALPFFGALWWSSVVPHAASCGLYQDDKRSVFVTSGTGYTIVPIRFFAPAQWDVLDVTLR